MKRLRSVLFVPGNLSAWMSKSPQYGADALILDLEDAVPPAGKIAARAMVRQALEELKPRGQNLYVRVNGLSTDLISDDLAAMLCPELDGIMLPKVFGPIDVTQIDDLLTYHEGRAGLAAGKIEVIACLETGAGLRNAYEVALAPRVATVLAGGAKGGDTSQSLGYIWTRDEQESLYLRSKVVLDCRAAGMRYLLSGLWGEIADLEGFERHCIANRHLGFTGEVLIHPSHVPIANRVYS